MEAFSSLPPPEPPRAMADAHMDLIMNTPQQSLLPQLIPLVPDRRFLPDSSNNPEDSRNHLKRSYSEEEKKRDEEDEELLFDIDEFLVEEDALIHGDHTTCCGDEKEGATIIAESPTNTNTNSNPMVQKETAHHLDGPIPDVASTNATIINVHHNNSCNDHSNSSKCNNSCKKKRKKKSPSKQPYTTLDTCVPPKRPLSAYNLYFREERKRKIADAASNHTKKYNFEELGRLIGKGWRSLPLKEKRELEARAEADRERYRNEMIAYRREKRRRAREEDQDTLLFMRQRHNAGGQLTPCPPSPQHPPASFSPKRNDPYPYQRYVTISPGQRDYPQEQQQQQQHHMYSQHNNSPNKNHVRKVSVSISSSPYNNNNNNSTDQHRTVNNRSPAVSSYESCSSLSGDEGREDRHKRKKNEERKRDGEDTSTKSRQEHPPTPDPRYSKAPPPPATHRAEVPVARVVAMPATDGLQRMLQESRQTYTPPPPPTESWAPWGHPPPHHFHHVPPPPYNPPAPVPADIRLYSPPSLPPPPLSIVGSSQQQQQQQQHYSAAPTVPLPPHMLPMGMSIILMDPATGKERSYTIQYTPKLMTQEQANQFQRDHEGGGGEKGQAQK